MMDAHAHGKKRAEGDAGSGSTIRGLAMVRERNKRGMAPFSGLSTLSNSTVSYRARFTTSSLAGNIRALAWFWPRNEGCVSFRAGISIAPFQEVVLPEQRSRRKRER